MNARHVVRNALIRKKIVRWRSIARGFASNTGNCSPSRARKNYWRLCARYPEIMLSLGWDEGSVY